MSYFSQPSVRGDWIAFVCDDDLWRVPITGGEALRLTSGLGLVSEPRFSPDGSQIAYLASDHGVMNIYVIPAAGGEAEKVLNISVTGLIGWQDDRTLLFNSHFESMYRGEGKAFALDIKKRELTRLPFGHATHLRFGQDGLVVLGRHCGDSAHWKRYKGGTAGVLWVRRGRKDRFKRILKEIPTNIASPQLVGNRIYFISDHEGTGNVYECNLNGGNLRRLTHHQEFYARALEHDGTSLVYQCGAEIRLYNLRSKEDQLVPIRCATPAVQAQPRYESPARYLDGYAVSNNGEELTVIGRGHAFVMPIWKGAPQAIDQVRDVRYSSPTYSEDNRFCYLAACDSREEEHVWVYEFRTRGLKRLLPKMNWGKIWAMSHSPKGPWLAVINNRQQLWLINTKTKKAKLIEQNKAQRPRDMAWSPDGTYLAYTSSLEDRRRSQVMIYNTRTQKLRPLMTPILADECPSFDPDGRYLYILSVREFVPCYNQTHFDLGFPFAGKPYAIPLRKDIGSPFDANFEPPNWDKTGSAKKEKPRVQIDFDGIEHRIIPFPTELGGYWRIAAGRGGVFMLREPVKPVMGDSWLEDRPGVDLSFYNFEESKEEVFHRQVKSFQVLANGENVLLATGDSLRLLPSKGKPSSEKRIGRRDGWIDLNRVRLKIHPREEWKQMYREAWVLQREHFWRPDMSKVDWQGVYKRYLPILAKVKTRHEFSDLMWEMQGELGTSHCYELGGDVFRQPHYYPTGYLGGRFRFNKTARSFVVEELFEGDSWSKDTDSPLLASAVGMRVGDEILALDGHGFSDSLSLYDALENKARCKVDLKIRRRGSRQPEQVTVTTLAVQSQLLYRSWVEANKAFVHKHSAGRLGYVHIPDMGPHGYAEFYRHYLSEHVYDGLIVDVRYNGGGHVSQHILKVLAQRPLGFDETRHGGREFFPSYAVQGVMVGLTNETAGSDGDIFSHSFKLMGLGPLIGKRTWGGVIGINGQYSLRDRTVTTQPEFSFWFKDVEWEVENYGTDPDIEVEITPEDWAAKRDPQLMRGIEEALKLLKRHPPFRPVVKTYPDLAQPKLPKI